LKLKPTTLLRTTILRPEKSQLPLYTSWLYTFWWYP